MMSMSGGWFFVVASEAITVGDTTFKLPGIGSYVALALEQRNIARRALRDPRDARRHPALRPAAVPPARRLVRPLPLRECARARRREDPWVLRALAPHARSCAGSAAMSAASLGRLTGLRLALPRDGAPRRQAGRRASWTRSGSRCSSWRSSSRVEKIVAYVSASLTLARPRCEALELGCFTLVRVVVLMALAIARLGAGRRLARPAPRLGAARAARRAIPRRLPGQPASSRSSSSRSCASRSTRISGSRR